MSKRLIVAFGRRFGETFIGLTEFVKEIRDELEGTKTPSPSTADAEKERITVSTREVHRWLSSSSVLIDL